VLLGRWLHGEGAARELRAVQEPSPWGVPGSAGPAPGVLLDRYVLLKPLGAGGMGLVFTAYDPLLDRTVAIKVMRHEVATAMPSSTRVRILREARAMARLSHPNVVSVHDAGLFHGRVYLAMEHMGGGSLAEWLQARPRSWQAIRDVFVRAGRGLAAAHARGLVHRDFKPQNVLFDHEGQVKISDFGLVRPSAALDAPGAEAVPSAPEAVSNASITRSSAILGTPGYIAPELLRGAIPDSRADQYSFAAALHLALHGRLPAGAGATAARPRIPDWLDRLIARGLSEDPTARYPSMESLLDELTSRDRRLRRRALAAATASLGLSAAGALIFAVLQEPPPCERYAERLTLAWGPSRRAEVRQAVLGSGVPVAAQTWERLEPTLDGYAREVSELYAGACRAVRLSRRAEERIAPTASCLAARIEDLGHRTAVLSRATPLMAREDAARAASELLPVRACASFGRPAAAPAPAPPGSWEKVGPVRQKLGQAWALYRAGEYAQGLALAGPLEAEARATEDPLLLAETLRLIGKLRSGASRYKDAAAALEPAMMAAVAAGKDQLAVVIASELADSLALQSQPEAATVWLDHGRAILTRLGKDPVAEASWLQARAAVLAVEGHWELAAPLLEAAVERMEQVFGPDHPRTAAVLVKLSRELKGAADLDRADRTATRALEIYERIYGPNHPDTLRALSARAQVARDRADVRSELALARRIQAAQQALYPEDSLEVAGARWTLGNALLNFGDPGAAAAEFQSALGTYQRTYGSPGEADARLASLHHYIGTCLYELGEDAQAEAEFQQELDLHSRARGTADPKLVHALTGLGLVSAAKGKLPEADERFQQAVAVARKAGEHNADLQYPYLAAAQASFEAGRYDRAEQSHLAALPFLASLIPAGSVKHATLEAKLAAAELGQGKAEAALHRAAQALAAMENALGRDHPLSVRALAVIGEARRRQGRPVAALELLQRAELLLERSPLRPLERGELLRSLARASHEAGLAPGRTQALMTAARTEFLKAGVWGRRRLAAEMRR
jgi:eukaryotic-like serine/threonine-protein kinase